MAVYTRRAVNPENYPLPTSTLRTDSYAYPKADAVMVHSIEFIATPQDGPRACKMIPEAVTATLQGVKGYSGCLVLATDEEARLVTVLTFWKGEDRQRRCTENGRWIYKLIGPYLDHRLRERTYVAHQPAATEAEDALAERDGRTPMAMRGNEVAAA